MNIYLIYTIIVNILISMAFNPTNIMLYNVDDMYYSITLFYIAMLMTTNIIWGHQIVRYLTYNKFSIQLFLIGISLSVITIYLSRQQLFVDDKNYLKRMISHHSVALQTSSKLLEKLEINGIVTEKHKKIYEFAKTIFKSQTKELNDMKILLTEISTY